MLFRVTRLSCASLAVALLVVAERFSSSQSTRTGAMGASLPSLHPLDSATAFCIPILMLALPPLIQSKSHMRKRACPDLCGRAISDGRFYRDS